MTIATEVAIANSAGATSIIPLNPYAVPNPVTWRVIQTAGGSFTYSVQGTIKDMNLTTSVAADWFDLVSGATTTRDGSYVSPLTGIRLLVTAVSASAASTLTMRVLQGGA